MTCQRRSFDATIREIQRNGLSRAERWSKSTSIGPHLRVARRDQFVTIVLTRQKFQKKRCEVENLTRTDHWALEDPTQSSSGSETPPSETARLRMRRGRNLRSRYASAVGHQGVGFSCTRTGTRNSGLNRNVVSQAHVLQGGSVQQLFYLIVVIVDEHGDFRPTPRRRHVRSLMWELEMAGKSNPNKRKTKKHRKCAYEPKEDEKYGYGMTPF
ncbi:hypothetical protein C8F01DRAFT_1230616 [Mycena amicta]|nr:hypothetical protein C8F01DRAFT_1230616 [Mycena amicta]